MTFEEIRNRWFEAKEDRRLEESELKETGRTDKYICYECPCGGTDHVAMRFFEPGVWNGEAYEEYQPYAQKARCVILNCFLTRKQWLIRPVDIAGIILKEEVKYLDLLKKAPSVIAKVVKKRGWSKETQDFLADTHGIDHELSGLYQGVEK